MKPLEPLRASWLRFIRNPDRNVFFQYAVCINQKSRTGIFLAQLDFHPSVRTGDPVDNMPRRVAVVCS